MADRAVVIVSNRGPVSFHRADDGQLVARRGAGGLVSGLAPLVRGTDTIWIAGAMSEVDRAAAQDGVVRAEGLRVRLVAVEPATWTAHYDGVCNEALWFAHHGLWDGITEPSWPGGWTAEHPWPAYRAVNEAFAEAVALEAPRGAAVLIQDYHLCLVAPHLRESRPDLRLVHFSHTPFAPPAHGRMLPTEAWRELLAGMAAHHAVGFHTERWADDFRASMAAAGPATGWGGHGGPDVFVAPLGPDLSDLEGTLASAAYEAATADLRATLGHRQLIARVDRIELSKNLVRGFDAYAALLEAEPRWRGEVVLGAFAYPSRQGVAAYDRYRRAVQERVAAVNERFGTDDWTPILYDDADDYPRSIAALGRADVLLVNPIRDGLNLVAKEGALVNRRNGTLVLSTEAGAWAELADVAYGVNPFDVGQTAAQLGAALAATDAERKDRWEAWRAASAAHSPATWLAAQLAAAG